MADKNGMGGIGIVVGADPKTKLVIIAFSTALNRIEIPPEAALDLARQIMTRAAIASGKAPEETPRHDS